MKYLLILCVLLVGCGNNSDLGRLQVAIEDNQSALDDLSESVYKIKNLQDKFTTNNTALEKLICEYKIQKIILYSADETVRESYVNKDGKYTFSCTGWEISEEYSRYLWENVFNKHEEISARCVDCKKEEQQNSPCVSFKNGDKFYNATNSYWCRCVNGVEVQEEDQTKECF